MKDDGILYSEPGGGADGTLSSEPITEVKLTGRGTEVREDGTLSSEPVPEAQTAGREAEAAWREAEADGTLSSEQVPEAESSDSEIAELEKRAQTEEAAAEVLAYRYFNGNGVRQDNGKALFWYAKSKTSRARFSEATVYLEEKRFPEAERALLAGLEAEDGDAVSAIDFKLGLLYLSGVLGEPDVKRAAQYLEAGLRLAPGEHPQYDGFLGQAMEQDGRRIPAIHWYRQAVEKYGQEKFRPALYRLYLTGSAGAAKKALAQEWFAAHPEVKA